MKIGAFVVAGIALVSLNSYALAQQPGQDILGEWQGAFTCDTFSLTFSITFEVDVDGYRGFFSSEDQRALGVPLFDIQVEGEELRFELRSDFYRYAFVGTLQQERIQGEMTAGDYQGTFVLERQQQPPASLTAEELQFERDGEVLHGTLRTPATGSEHPVLFFVTSSGNSDRSASQYLAVYFAKRGFITFHYDKRGTGLSTGSWVGASIEALAEDDLAGLNFLRERLGVRRSFGIMGSSQGGAKVPYILGKMPDLSFGISVSTPGMALWESDTNHMQNRLNEAVPAEAREQAFELQRLALQYGATGKGEGNLKALQKQYKQEEWYRHIYFVPLELEAAYRVTGSYDALAHWPLVTQPVLIMEAEQDENVPAWGYPRIKQALDQAGNAHYIFVKVKNANHAMYLVDEQSCFPPWTKSAPGYVEAMYTWVTDLLASD